MTDKELFEEMGNFIIEPLTMTFFGNGWDREKHKFITSNESDWVNPAIDYFVSEFCEPSTFNEGYHDGPIIRVMIDDHKNNRHCHWAAMMTQKGYDLLFDYDFDEISKADLKKDEVRNRYVSYVIGFVQTIMFDDVYSCVDGQFMQTYEDVYESFNEFLRSETTEISFTPDIGLRGDWEEGWGWDT